ncbi:MAG: type II toxin-antitoxin system RelE/ParE family toxin [Planctomycetes bacterium]|nr:type II toxin-antitoxin system RelE/ParE family toxin [Planctomycetota bacterium]
MKRVVHRTPRARADLAEQAAYYAMRDSALAVRFLEAAQGAFEELLATPLLGSTYACQSGRLVDLRRWRIPGFERTLVFYRIIDHGIEVVRVLHGARDISALLDVDDEGSAV